MRGIPNLFLSHIDIVNNTYVSGWCINRLLPQLPVQLKIYGNGTLLGSSRCQIMRQDVKEARLHSSGKCGFVFRFPGGILEPGTTLEFSAKGWPGKRFAISAEQIEPVIETGKPLFFVHIPKTAGTSFNNHVQSWFGFNCWHIHTETYPQDYLNTLVQPGNYLAGHLPLARLETLFGDLSRLSLHSILREPVSQLHSHIAWIKGIGADQRSAFFRSHPPVVQSLATKLQQQAVDTPAELYRFVSRLDGFEWDFFDNIQTRYFLSRRPDKVTDIEVSEAIVNLDLLQSVGLTENYSAYLETVSRHYHRQYRPQSTQHNKAKVAPVFDITNAGIRSAIDPLVRFDQQLYNATRQKLAQQFWQSPATPDVIQSPPVI